MLKVENVGSRKVCRESNKPPTIAHKSDYCVKYVNGITSHFSTQIIRTALTPRKVHHYQSQIQPAQPISNSFFTYWPFSQKCLFTPSIRIPQPNHSGRWYLFICNRVHLPHFPSPPQPLTASDYGSCNKKQGDTYHPKKCPQVKKMWPQKRNWIRQYKRGNFVVENFPGNGLGALCAFLCRCIFILLRLVGLRNAPESCLELCSVFPQVTITIFT